MNSSSELVTPETVSLESLRDLFDAAMMDATLDEDNGSIRLKEDIMCRVSLHESKERIGLIAFYGIKEDAQRIDRLELVNRINDQFLMIRACIEDDGDLCFDYTIVLKGGVTRKQIAHSARNFIKLVPKAVSECDEDGIVE